MTTESNEAENEKTVSGHLKRGVINECLPPNNTKGCPTAHNGCKCMCHTVPGVMHCVPCCYPTENGKVYE